QLTILSPARLQGSRAGFLFRLALPSPSPPPPGPHLHPTLDATFPVPGGVHPPGSAPQSYPPSTRPPALFIRMLTRSNDLSSRVRPRPPRIPAGSPPGAVTGRARHDPPEFGVVERRHAAAVDAAEGRVDLVPSASVPPQGTPHPEEPGVPLP